MRVAVNESGNNVGIGEINESRALGDLLAGVLHGLNALAFHDEDDITAVAAGARVEEMSYADCGGGRLRRLLSECGYNERSTGEKGEETIQSMTPAENSQVGWLSAVLNETQVSVNRKVKPK